MTQMRANGINIEVEEYGDRSAPSILLVCGWSVQLTYWPRSFVNQLVDAGFHVIAFDNRDSGLSYKSPTSLVAPLAGVRALAARMLKSRRMAPYTLETLADDAIGVLDALGIDRAHILGLSMGGMIAQIVTAKYPDRILTLTVLMSTTNRFGLPKGKPRVMLDVFMGRPPIRHAARVARGVRLSRLVGTPDGGYDPILVKQGVNESVDRCYTPLGRMKQLQAIFATGDIRRWTRSISAPTLVLHGTLDPLLPPHNGVDVASNINGSKFKLIEGLGHDLPPKKLHQVCSLIVRHSRTENQDQPRLR